MVTRVADGGGEPFQITVAPSGTVIGGVTRPEARGQHIQRDDATAYTPDATSKAVDAN